jgi:hypothetical protein
VIQKPKKQPQEEQFVLKQTTPEESEEEYSGDEEVEDEEEIEETVAAQKKSTLESAVKVETLAPVEEEVVVKTTKVVEKSPVATVILASVDDANEVTATHISKKTTTTVVDAMEGLTAPNFVQFLHSTIATVGEDVTLSCEITGQPALTISWAKDGVSLSESETLRFKTDGNLYSLILSKVGLNDAGKYTITARNDAGQTSCTASVLVHDGGEGEIRIITSSDQQDAGDDTVNRITRVTKKTTTTVINTTEGMISPKFQQFLKSAIATIGEEVTLRCQISGEPAPQISWAKDGVSLSESETLHFKSDGDIYSLILSKTALSDSGKYTITARNDAGQTSCTATLLVHDGSEGEYEIVSSEGQEMSIPSFTQFLKSQVVKAGASATLECIIDCKPATPKVTWSFKGVSVTASDNIQLYSSDDGRLYRLTIVQVSASDAGEYTVTAATDNAHISCTATVLIQPESTEEQITIKTTSTVQKTSSSGAVVGGMSFTKYPESQVVKVDASATFVCHIQAEEQPQVTWSKAGAELSNSDKFSIAAADNTYSLTVNNAQISDSGEYKIMASTSGGRLSCTVTLVVTDEDVVIVRQETQSASESESEAEESEEESESEEE